MGGQAQNQTVDPAIQQITEFIFNSINNGDDPVSIVAGLVEQQVDEQIIAQAFMTAGYQQEDVMALFEEVQKQSQPPPPASTEEQTRDPQEIARNQSLEIEAQEAEAQQEQAMVAQQDAMSQNLMAKSGIEIKPENKGKFTRWAKARGMSVLEAARKVMSNPDAYSTSVVKMANFAKNAAGWKREDGGEFIPHEMHKGNKSRKANTYDQHLKLKEMGYVHKAQSGTELTEAQNFFNTTGVVKKDDVLTSSPNYANPLAFETKKNFNLGQVASVVGNIANRTLGEDGTITNRKTRRANRKEGKGDYYNYDVTIDENDPNTYAFDNLDLFNASKNNGTLRDLQTFTDDVNENSRANFNVETGEYDTLISSRPLSEDRYGERKGFLGIGKKDANSTYEFGENLNYFNEYADGDTKDLILGTQDDPEGTTLGIDEQGNASSYAPGAINPYYHDTMMGRNKVSDSMIPTGFTGQPEAGMYKDYQDNPIDRIMDFNQNPYNPDIDGDGIPNTVDRLGSAELIGGPTSAQSGPRAPQANTTPIARPSFRSWYAQNASNFQGKSQSQLQEIYNSIGDDEFRYGGVPKAQEGNGSGPVSSAWNSLKSGVSGAANYYNENVRPALKMINADPITNTSNALDALSIPGALVAEAGEWYTGRGDGEFNFTDAMPGMKGDFSFKNMNDGEMKNLAALEDAEGNPLVENPWLALGANIVTDPSTYVGAGIFKNILKKGIKEGVEQVGKAGAKTLVAGKYGGFLPQAQAGGGDWEAMFPDPYNVGDNNQNIEGPINPATGEPWEQTQESTEQYVPYFTENDDDMYGLHNINASEDIVYDPTPRGNGINNASGMFNVNQDFGLPTPPPSNIQTPSFGDQLNKLSSTGAIPEGAEKVDGPQVSNLISTLENYDGSNQQGPPSYSEPVVDRKNKLEGGYNRFMDSRGMEIYKNVSDDAVKIAGVANNYFEDKAYADAKAENRHNLVADEIYGTNEDPFMKRGAWDVNTGTFGSEGQRTVRTNMGIAKQGMEINNGDTVDVDSTTLAKLIAAGADIEIL